MDFSLFYFADHGNPADHGNEDAETGRYRLLLDGARFADENGFRAVWTPERHFHEFGGIYPNPAVTAAAVAAVTQRVHVRAGSVVAPLHHPLRVAEEWSVVDNISGGRAGVSFASGWHARDFALNPDQYTGRKAAMFERIDEIRRLWRGGSLSVRDGSGTPTEVRTFPRPIQPELPVWITSGGDIETFRAAGRARAGLLTHLLGQDLDRLAGKIAEYRREAMNADPAGWPGHVVLMVHTFVGPDDDAVRTAVREPMSAYLRSSLGLIQASLGAAAASMDLDDLDPEDVDFLVDRAFDRYFDHDGMLGSVDKVRKVVARLRQLGIDEVACLIDFGLPTEQVLDGLTHLNHLRRLCQEDEAL